MTDATKRKIVTTAIIVGCLIMVAWPQFPLKDASDRLERIGKAHGGYTAHELPIRDSDITTLGSAQAVSYFIETGKKSGYFLTAIDGTKNRHAVHDPSYCMSGAGWKVDEQKELSLPRGSGILLTVHREKEQTQVLCFYDDGEQQFSSPFDYWAKTSLRRLSLGMSGEEPIFVMCKPAPNQGVDWNQVRRSLITVLDSGAVSR
jgi:hypothetical protein